MSTISYYHQLVSQENQKKDFFSPHKTCLKDTKNKPTDILCWLFAAKYFLCRLIIRGRVCHGIFNHIFIGKNHKRCHLHSFYSLVLYGDKLRTIWAQSWRGADSSAVPQQRDGEGRGVRGEGEAVLSLWWKCHHGRSALTLLTHRFLYMRSFWTADLNIIVLRGWKSSSRVSYHTALQRRHQGACV